MIELLELESPVLSCEELGLGSIMLMPVFTQMQAEQLLVLLQGVAFADCERLTSSDREAGAMFQAVESMCGELKGNLKRVY